MDVLVRTGRAQYLKQGNGYPLGWLIMPLLEACVRMNQQILRVYQVPPLYKAGVRYQEEPADQGFEEFALVPQVYARHWGDCDDLATWRCAELREQGERATIRVVWKNPSIGGLRHRLYHVIVRRADRTVEDPSKILGMGR